MTSYVLTHPAKFVLFGDSITQFGFSVELRGWAALLANEYERKADVINRGLSGYNTRWALTVLPQMLMEFREAPALFTIFFGANDAALLEHCPQQHVPLAEYRQNLSSLVRTIQQKFPSSAVVVIAPPCLHEPGWAEECRKKGQSQSNRTSEVSAQYSSAAVEVARSCGVQFLNLTELMKQSREDWQVYLRDGLHLSIEGNAFVYRQLRALIDDQLPQLRSESLPWYYPYWATVDNDHPDLTLKQACSPSQ
eukprot:TRINITY_DN12938_c0_g1_i1.p1 TRINITY_DN12938_c0_g1~~TRINITY_DN12938_c0_g1_i1.p1  ORF type:complete len:251 (-),score=29.50 TRINITY_DN12938_c0_g1_i1:8-760(-)